MQFTCTQENLARGMQIVARLSDKGVNLPILSNVLIKTTNNSISLSATNLEIGVVTTIRGKIDEPGEFTVNARLLADLVSSLKDENITVTKTETALVFTGENHETTLRGTDATEFPVIPEVDALFVCSAAHEELVATLEHVAHATSVDEARPELCGAYLQFSETAMTAAATDSYRLSEYTCPIKVEVSSSRNVIVPGRTINEVARILALDAAETITIQTSDSQILFSIGDTELTSRIIAGNYPDYHQIIPQQFKQVTEFVVADMVRAIKTTSLFCKQGINDVRITYSKKDKAIHLQAENGTAGKNISTIATTGHEQDLDIVFNYKFLLDGLQHMGSEKASLKTNDAASPALLSPSKASTALYIIMPIRQ